MNQEIQGMLDKIGSYPHKPARPTLMTGANSQTIRRYADAYENYEKQIAEFEIAKIAWNKQKAEIEDRIIELIKDKSGLNSIPDQYRYKVWAKAWEDGHSSGFYEVYLELCDLVEIFE